MQKPFYNSQDIMKLMNCGRNKAYEYIRAIKSVSDVGKTAGRVMVRDFNLWAYGTAKGGDECEIRDYSQAEKYQSERISTTN